MQEFLEQITLLVKKVRDLESAFYRIRRLVFPTGSGKFQVPKYHGDPADAENGDIWYDLDTDKYRGREGGTNVDLI